MLEADFAIVHRSTSTQLLELIIEPLRSSTPSHSAPFLVVVDGLDECEGKDNHLQILSHISELTTKYHLPARILIISHPKPSIKHFFDVSISQGAVLDSRSTDIARNTMVSTTSSVANSTESRLRRGMLQVAFNPCPHR